jgi:hypothetical protein
VAAQLVVPRVVLGSLISVLVVFSALRTHETYRNFGSGAGQETHVRQVQVATATNNQFCGSELTVPFQGSVTTLRNFVLGEGRIN